jgi:2,4-dienoyl-CoA reductase-like NADH-dependent reductase (Old Yellow Enzyme family)
MSLYLLLEIGIFYLLSHTLINRYLLTNYSLLTHYQSHFIMSESPLASPITLSCGVTIPNRLVKAAMTESLADEWGRSTPKLCRLYEVWSEGGAGLLITGNVQVDRRYVERPGNVCIDGNQDEEQLERLRAFAKAGQKGGAKIFVQLGHAGRQSNGMVSVSL